MHFAPCQRPVPKHCSQRYANVGHSASRQFTALQLFGPWTSDMVVRIAITVKELLPKMHVGASLNQQRLNVILLCKLSEWHFHSPLASRKVWGEPQCLRPKDHISPWPNILYRSSRLVLFSKSLTLQQASCFALDFMLNALTWAETSLMRVTKYRASYRPHIHDCNIGFYHHSRYDFLVYLRRYGSASHCSLNFREQA